MKRIGLVLFIVSTILYAMVSWYRIVTTTAPDFSVFYGATRLFIEGKPLSGDTGLYTGFGYPPMTLLLFLPFMLLPYQLAQGIWVTMSFALIPVLAYISLRFINKSTLLTIVSVSCIFFWSFPTKWTLGMGQVNLVSICLLLAGVWYIKHATIASVLFWLLMLSKPHFGILFPFLLLRGNVWPVIGAGLLYLCSSLLVAGLFGPDYFFTYLTHEVPPLLAFAGRDIYYNQSFGAFFSRILSLDIAKLLTQVCSVIVLAGCFFKRNSSTIDFLSIFLPVFLLVEPLGWQHHYVFILPVYVWLWYQKTNRWFLVLFFLLISWNFKQPQVVSHPLLLSHGFFGAVLLCILAFRMTVRDTRSI